MEVIWSDLHFRKISLKKKKKERSVFYQRVIKLGTNCSYPEEK